MTVCSVFTMPAQAMGVETGAVAKIAIKKQDEVAPCQVVYSVKLPADLCQSMYDSFKPYDTWPNDLASVLAGATGSTIVGGAVVVAGMMQHLNFLMVKETLRRGAANGYGCTLLVYDNAQPSIVLNYS